MAKKIKPTTREHISLALELYNRIPQGRKVTAQMLQEDLKQSGIKRDIRTIQRNLDLIVNYFNVDKDTRDKPFGYSRNIQSKLIFWPRENIILGLAESYLHAVLPQELSTIINSAFNQIQILSLSRMSQLYIKSKVFTDLIQVSKEYPVNINTLFENICFSLIHQRLISIENHHSIIHRNIKPLGIIIINSELYLIYKNNKIEQIQLNNIKLINISSFTFKYPNNFNINEYRKNIKVLDNNSQL